MRVCIHRGSKEIGGSCVELECANQRLLLDLGLPLDAQRNHEKYLPNISGLDGSGNSLKGILISHPHIDHYGLLAHISPDIPIGMGGAARRILLAASPFMPGEPFTSTEGWEYESGKSFEIGPFCITPFLVDHSAYDSYSFLIEAGGKRLFYSGDFRAHGRKASLVEKLIENPPIDIDTLLLEGTTIGRIRDDQDFLGEAEVEKELMEVFKDTEGLVMVQTSAQNIDRVVTVLRASKRTGRKLIVDLYTAAILEATGNCNVPQSDWPEVVLYIPQRQRIQIKKNQWYELLEKHSSNRVFIEDLKELAKNATLLFRPVHERDLESVGCLEGASLVYSQWEGYWQRGSYDKTKAWLKSHGIKKYSIHTSGHASPVDLKRFSKAMRAKRVVPIHSSQPERYAELFSNVELKEDGEWWEV